MTQPKHGDTATCKHCGKPIHYWDANPAHLGAHWFHTGRTYPEGAGAHPDYCDETVAEV